MKKQEPVYTISEFGQKARITVRTLRFYEELGLIIPAQKNSAGHRLYGLEELAKLQLIQSLKFIGYSLQEIKNLLEDDVKGLPQLEKSLAWQHQLLTEKRNELNRAIEAVERIQMLMSEGKPITWALLRSLLYEMEHEQEQEQWVREYFSEDIVNHFFSLSKEQRKQIDLEMLELLSTIKELIKNGASPQSPEAFDVLTRLTEMVTRHIDDHEAFAEQLEKAQQSMETEELDFKFPNFFTEEEEAFLTAIGEAMEEMYKEENNL
ncbi:MerR family transcriptional regulator [Robertmurraya siralis]|uniref:MerR family transcriptional regulator n=1 Tax=Robertmurraya siralis TaxID=77777 RepID=A0A919WIX4_9BACI|nr:MerR family transcriptional regulator [Robertmurraya siralis]GIN62633.1 MerR family transcriptional regulator [Robertmurraya siralis]